MSYKLIIPPRRPQYNSAISVLNKRVVAGDDKLRKEIRGSSIPAFHKYTEHVSSEHAYKSQFGYDNSAAINFSLPIGFTDSSIINKKKYILLFCYYLIIFLHNF